MIQERVFLDPGGWFQPAEPTPFLADVQTAVFENRRLRLVYRRADGQWIKRLVDDYVQLTTSRRVAPVEKHNSSLLVLFKENWEPSLFKRLWQEKHGLK